MVDPTYQVTERRPMRAREWLVLKRTARWLARRNVSPNSISLAGLVCATGAGVTMALTAHLPHGARIAWLTSALLIQFRALANLLDGMVAVERGVASPVGELYNEVPDRVSDAAMLVGAGCASGGNVVLGCVAAYLALFTAYIRATGKAVGAPHEFCGPMAKQHRMAVMTAICLSGAVAPRSWQALWGNPPIWGLASAALVLIIAGALLTAVRRLRRIVVSLRMNRP